MREWRWETKAERIVHRKERIVAFFAWGLSVADLLRCGFPQWEIDAALRQALRPGRRKEE